MTVRPLVLSVAVVISLLVTGCTQTAEPIATPTPTATAVALPDPEFVEDGDTEDNKAYFDWIVTAVATVDQKQPGKAMVNALVQAGFSKRDMQVTPDVTKTGLPADSVIVAVQIKRSCLIGQRTVGKEFFSSIEPALKTGGCLVGITRKIDW